MHRHEWQEAEPPAGVERRLRCWRCRVTLDLIPEGRGRVRVEILTPDGRSPPAEVVAKAQALLQQGPRGR